MSRVVSKDVPVCKWLRILTLQSESERRSFSGHDEGSSSKIAFGCIARPSPYHIDTLVFLSRQTLSTARYSTFAQDSHAFCLGGCFSPERGQFVSLGFVLSMSMNMTLTQPSSCPLSPCCIKTIAIVSPTPESCPAGLQVCSSMLFDSIRRENRLLSERQHLLSRTRTSETCH